MKIIDDDDMMQVTVGNYGFSGIRPESLGSTEYTLCTLVVDITGSLSGYESILLNMAKEVVGACKKNPRAEHLMLRRTEFNSQVYERNGFIEVNSLDTDKWQATPCTGVTHLYDAVLAAIQATNSYAGTLSSQEFGVNGCIFVITDGVDIGSVASPAMVKKALSAGVTAEQIESLNVVLIGVNASQYQRELTTFQNEAGLQQYVDAGQADAKSLAKLANFVANSISSQSQSLGTGGPSQALTF